MQTIYIESADEVTTVIERLHAVDDAAVALVVPKGAALVQSVVNLKLVRKAAADTGKQIVIVSTDPIGRNLCTQLGIPIASNEKGATEALAGSAEAGDEESAHVIAGVRIHRYYEEEKSGEEEKAPEPILIPKDMLATEKAEAATPTPIEVPVAPPVPAAPEAEAPAFTRRTIERDEAPAAVASEPEKPGKQKVIKEKTPITKGQKRVVKLSLFMGGLAVVAIVTLAFLFLPAMHVVIAVSANDWREELAFTAKTTQQGVSEDHATVPAEVVSVTADDSLVFKATGTKKVGTAATGTAALYNYDSTSAVTVPSGTTITASNKTFKTTESVVVPGFTQEGSGKPRVPGSKTAAIAATEVGTESNLSNASASDITVNGVILSSITVTTTGGTSTDVAIISAQDIAAAKDGLTAKLSDAARAKVADQLKDRSYIYKEEKDLLKTGELTSSLAVGAEAAEATMTGSLTLTRTFVDQKVLDSALADRLRTKQLSERTYTQDNREYLITAYNTDNTELAILATAIGKEAPVVPEETLVRRMRGQSIENGKAFILQEVPNAVVTVEQHPGWWPLKRYPTVDRYITLDVKYE